MSMIKFEIILVREIGRQKEMTQSDGVIRANMKEILKSPVRKVENYKCINERISIYVYPIQ